MNNQTDVSSFSSTDVTEQTIAALAYELWQARGCPEGSPEIDWYLAEQEIQRTTSTAVRAQAAAA